MSAQFARSAAPGPLDLKKGEAVWRDPQGVEHWAIGAMAIPEALDTLVVWTACERYDVPVMAHARVTLPHVVDCAACSTAPVEAVGFDEGPRL